MCCRCAPAPDQQINSSTDENYNIHTLLENYTIHHTMNGINRFDVAQEKISGVENIVIETIQN